MDLSLADNKLFFGPKHNIYTFFMILFGLFDLKLLFVCQFCHVKQKIKNKRFLKKNLVALPGCRRRVRTGKMRRPELRPENRWEYFPFCTRKRKREGCQEIQGAEEGISEEHKSRFSCCYFLFLAFFCVVSTHQIRTIFYFYLSMLNVPHTLSICIGLH